MRPPYRRSLHHDVAVVRTFSYRYQGEVARAVLDAAGIPCMLQVDDSGGSEIGMAFANPARLLVRVEDLEQAEELLVTPDGSKP